MFSTVNALVLRPISLPEPDRLAVVVETHLERNLPRFDASIPNYYDWRSRSQSWASLAAVTGRNLNLTDGAEPELLQAFAVTDNFLPTLGAPLVLGRNFLAEEDRPGGDAGRDSLGRVLAAAARRRAQRARPDAGTGWKRAHRSSACSLRTRRCRSGSMSLCRSRPMWPGMARMNHYIEVFGRLKPGVTIEQADAEMKNLAAQIFRELPAEDRGWSTRVMPLGARGRRRRRATRASTCSWAPSGFCSSSPAPTSRTSSSFAPPPAPMSWRCAPRSARVAGGSRDNLSAKACSSPCSVAPRARCSRGGRSMRCARCPCRARRRFRPTRGCSPWRVRRPC